jgi:hypothetical protein
VRRNLAGIDAGGLCPDLAGFDLDAWLGGLAPAAGANQSIKMSSSKATAGVPS